MSLARMAAWTGELPEQLRLSLERAEARDWPQILGAPSLAPTFVGAMGGSAIAAKLSRTLLAPESPGPIEIGSDPHLPAWIPGGQPGLVSYSGSTWEVLALWEQLGERGARPWVVASGGELIERARAAGAPGLLVPTGYPPRAALGWLLPPVALALAASAGSRAVESVCAGVRDASVVLAAERDLWKQGRALPGRDPDQIADRLVGTRVAFLVAYESSQALAFRWKNQCEENGKQVTQVVPFPEATHNEIEGWARLGGGVLVSLETPAPGTEARSVAVRRGAALAAALAAARAAGLDVLHVPLDPAAGGSRWAGFLSQVLLADHVSLRLAERNEVDPEPVPVLDGVKHAVRSVVADPPGPGPAVLD